MRKRSWLWPLVLGLVLTALTGTALAAQYTEEEIEYDENGTGC